jgi:nucleoside-diphosphate-sugar epimerase
MRVLFIGGTGPVGQAAVPHLLDAGHDVVLAHTGADEPSALSPLEHLHGERGALLAPGGPAERARPEAIWTRSPAALDRAPVGTSPCNVGDPRDLTFGGLAALVAERLGWEWEIEDVAWSESDHPWNVRHPVVADTTRLQEQLGVREPDPLEATLAQIDWLWERRT